MQKKVSFCSRLVLKTATRVGRQAVHSFTNYTVISEIFELVAQALRLEEMDE